MKRITLLIVSIFAILSMAYGQDSEPDYLCFEVTAGTTIKFGAPSKLEYSLDKTSWSTMTNDGVKAITDCKVYFRGNNPQGLNKSNAYSSFVVSAPAKCSGNVMTLIDKTGETTEIPNNYCFYRLFYNCKITTAPKLYALSLKNYCYCEMFSGCSKLTQPPDLPALTLAEGCYVKMFSDCSELVVAPKLPATLLSPYCYLNMFLNCTSLISTPILPATKLVEGCYVNMFYGCTNLQKAVLTFTQSDYDIDQQVNGNYNYGTMTFKGMFQGCIKLNYISVKFTQWYQSRTWYYGSTALNKEYQTYYVSTYWVKNVSSTGTFVCPKKLPLRYGNDNIPKGWTVKYIEDLFSVTIPESSKPFISTPYSTGLDVGDEVSFSVLDRSSEGLIPIVTVQGTNPIETTQSGNDYTFTMPAEDVTISVSYTPIKYSITTDEYSSAVAEASAGETVDVTFANRDGYCLSSATYNGTALTITNNTASFTMPAANVIITTTYTKIDYTITTDQYSTPNKTTANVGDDITVTFTNRDGYNLISATYNGTALTITNNSASFTMPAANVTIATTYTKNDYTITADQYSTPNKTTANVGDEITVTFTNRDGYNLTSATYNGTALTITNNTATFTMPAANVSIVTTYTPIEYNITAGEYVTANKSKATLNDQVSFTIADRTADGYQLDKVLINNTEISGTSFNMADYLTDVTITAVYSKIGYTITTDAYSTPSKTKANVGDEITVTFSKRDGYNLTSATYNGTALTIVDYKSQFTMPDEDVEIKTVYTVEQQQITKPEIITDNNVEITLPENLTENTEVTFTVQQKPGFTAFVYVNGVLTNEYKFVFTGKVEIKVDYKELTVSNISAETESYCAGDEINLTFATNPYAVEYELTFSNEAQKEGFENIDFHPVASYEQQPASFKIPQSAKPGKYHAFIRVKDSKDSHSKQYAFDFEVLYPTDIIETKYSDLICVNNSKNEYIGYQWFKNNKEIKGADKQFYIDAPMLNGSYSVALILKNGEKIRTCNYIVNNPTLKKSLKPSVNVYPNPAKSSAPIVVELSEMDDLTDAYILIYNQLGVQIDKISNLSPHNTLSLKKGFYHGVVICGSTKLTFKIIVNE